MFARYFVELPLPPDLVEDLVERASETWMRDLAEEATRRGERLLVEVGFGGSPRITRTVAITLGEPVRMPSKTAIPMRWEVVGAGGLFPELDADLEIAPLGGRTQLAVSARYVPPLGTLGRLIDRAVLSRVAEATLKDFLDRLAESLVAGSRREPLTAGDARSDTPSGRPVT